MDYKDIFGSWFGQEEPKEHEKAEPPLTLSQCVTTFMRDNPDRVKELAHYDPCPWMTRMLKK